MTISQKESIYSCQHRSVTTGLVIPSRTNSPPAEVANVFKDTKAKAFTTEIPNGLYHGKMIFISGTPTAATRFTINIQDRALHDADIGLHFDVRFNHLEDVNIIVRNHKSRSNWGQEEREIPYFPFVPNVNFEMIIVCENSGFKISVNNHDFVEFKHRFILFPRFNMLEVRGDVILNQVKFH